MRQIAGDGTRAGMRRVPDDRVQSARTRMAEIVGRMRCHGAVGIPAPGKLD